MDSVVRTQRRESVTAQKFKTVPLNTMQKLPKAALILLIAVLAGVILHFGKPFLVPLVIAILLAILLLPISAWLEKKGVNRALSAILADLLLVVLFAGLIAFFTWQATDMAKKATNIEQQISTQYQKAQKFVSEKLGVPAEKQKEMLKKQQSSGGGKLAGAVTGFIAGMGGMIANSLLILVYIFLFIYYRRKIKRFLIRIVPNNEEGNTREVIDRSQMVIQKYLGGLALMIIALWVMYAIGFSIAGVESPILFAILCGTLEIVPFIGNLIGNALTIIATLAQGGGMNVVIGILITYAVVQTFQSYVLEPLVVGSEVNINPLFTIVGLIAAETIWGIAGMVVAIPVMGVTKIICDHVEPLKPYGEFMGEKKKSGGGFKKKMKGITRSIKQRFS